MWSPCGRKVLTHTEARTTLSSRANQVGNRVGESDPSCQNFGLNISNEHLTASEVELVGGACQEWFERRKQWEQFKQVIAQHRSIAIKLLCFFCFSDRAFCGEAIENNASN